MDARSALQWLLTAALLALIGCDSLVQDPSARREEPQAGNQEHGPAPEPPQVVDSEPEGAEQSPEAELHRTVQSFIERVDDARQRARQRDATLASDASNTVPPSPVVQPLDPVRPQEEAADPEPAAGPTKEEPESEPAPEPAAEFSPPRVESVVARGVPDTQPVEADPQSAAVNAPVRAQVTIRSLSDLLAQLPAVDEGSFREQLDRRLLAVIAGEYEQALEPLNLVTEEQQQLARHMVDTLIAVREWHMGDQAGAARAASEPLEKLLMALRPLNDLSIPALRICSEVRGYGQYEPIEPARFLAGIAAEFVLYCELSDFVSERRGDGSYYTEFDMTTTILNRAGDTVLELNDTGILDRSANLRHDFFISRLVRLPVTLSPGRYVAKVTIVDKLGQKVAENRAPFELTASP